jgi:capsular exopolysaccharide synthesis family protein
MDDKLDLELELAREPVFNGGAALIRPIVYSQTKKRPIPEARLKEKKVISTQETGAVADAFKILRTQLIHRLEENNWNAIGITSPREGEGKTLTAINLAISFSSISERTVLLIDSDFKKPGIQAIFSLDEKGLVNYLLDEDPLEELLINPGIDRLVILPTGRPIPNSSDLIVSSKMLRMVREVKLRYKERIVFFDLPPLLPSSDVLSLSPHLDAILLVIESGKTEEKDLIQSMERLKGIPIIGTVLNKV